MGEMATQIDRSTDVMRALGALETSCLPSPVTIPAKIMILVVDTEMNMTQIKWVFCYFYKNHLTT